MTIVAINIFPRGHQTLTERVTRYAICPGSGCSSFPSFEAFLSMAGVRRPNPHQADETLRYQFIVDLPIKNGDFPVRYVNVDQTVILASGQRSIEFNDFPWLVVFRTYFSRENWPEGISSYVMGSKHLFIHIFMVFSRFLDDFPSQTSMISPSWWRLGGRAGDAQRCDSSVLGGSVRGISMICWDPLYMRAIYQYHGSLIFCWVG